MAIFVDVSSAVHARAGLARYASNLVAALRPLLGHRLRLFQNSYPHRGPLEGWEGWPMVGVPWGYKPWRLLVWMGQFARLPFDSHLPEAELFHATEHLLPYLRRVPSVLTVHDLVFERYPEYHKRWNYLYLHTAMPLFCARASAIIAISQATRADLMGYYGVPPDKITVIPEAAGRAFVPQPASSIEAARRSYAIPERYLLTVGTLEPRKNLARLVDACGPLFAEDLAEALVIVGGKGWLYEGFFQRLEECAYRDRIIVPGYVADEHLPALYSGALLTVQPSLYEGFGLPVLEAMACGSPVCCSSTSSLPEVGGAAARYFSPEDVAEMTALLLNVLRDEALRAEMRAAGLQRAALFSWEHTALLTAAFYEQVCSI